MINIEEYISDFYKAFPENDETMPWTFISRLPEILVRMIGRLDNNFIVQNDVAVHRSATVDSTAVVRGPAIIDENAMVGCYALLRSGTYVGRKSIIGAHGEFKNSIIMNGSACGHFNFVGESLVGSNVNLEAGAVLANHFNELKDRNVKVKIGSELIDTGVVKFGSMIGDGSRIGANAVLYPGILLPQNSVIERLQLLK